MITTVTAEPHRSAFRSEPLVELRDLAVEYGLGDRSVRAVDGVNLSIAPGETYVEYQLLAEKLRPDRFVMTLGYGDAATGYIPTASQIAEHDGNLRDWCWVDATAETVLTEGLKAALKAGG